MDNKDDVGIKDKIHIVLTGSNGKIKDERKIEEAPGETTK